jgi:DNA-binding transcriptional MerR regulator
MDRGDEHLTIDELARRTGMTVRNIRAHQSRGLVPPPEVRGRTGFYGPEHVARVELIKELQADGFSLELIRRLLQGTQGSVRDALRFTRALHAPFANEEPQVVDLAQLREQWLVGGRRGRGARDTLPALVRRAEKLGLLRSVGEGRYEVVSPRLGRAAAELASLGISTRKSLDLAALLRGHAEAVAETFVQLFLDAVWKPFERAGRPEDGWPLVADALERLLPLASESLLAVFELVMREAVDQAFGRELQRLGAASAENVG